MLSLCAVLFFSKSCVCSIVNLIIISSSWVTCTFLRTPATIPDISLLLQGYLVIGLQKRQHKFAKSVREIQQTFKGVDYGRTINTRPKKLCEDNMKIVHLVAKRTKTRLLDYDDICGYGFLGLVKGARTYEKNLGYKLSTYLVRCVENEIWGELRHLEEVFSVDEYEIAVKSKIQQNLEYKETVKEVYDNLKHKEVFDYLLGNKTQTKIAEEVGVSQGIISRRYKAEKENLQKVLGDKL